MALPGASQVGWYGKLPAFGDFASRRLPSAFIRDYDAWLAQSLLHARTLLGTDWTQTYLDCPVWRFLLPPGVLGPEQHETWAGVMMASVDRVGRQFPFTLAAALEGVIEPSENLPALVRWWTGLEDVALDALQNDLDGDALDAELEALFSGAVPRPSSFAPMDPVSTDGFSIDDFGLDPPESDLLIPDFPASGVVAANAAAGMLDDVLSGDAPSGTHEAAGYNDAELSQAAWLGALLPESGFPASGHSLWSVTPTQGAAPCLAVHCVAGMPDVFQFVAMLRTRPALIRTSIDPET